MTERILIAAAAQVEPILEPVASAQAGRLRGVTENDAGRGSPGHQDGWVTCDIQVIAWLL